MMNSNPGRVFIFNCEGREAVFRWSDDRGQSISGRFIVAEGTSTEFDCSYSGPWGLEGSDSITRVRYSERRRAGVTLERHDVVRISYPAINSGGLQVVHVFEVELTLGQAPKSRLVATLSAPTGHVLQAAAAEPDPSEVPHSLIEERIGPGVIETSLAHKLGTALITWKVVSTNGPVVKLQGAFFDARTGDVGPQFNIAEWAGRNKTGDYSKIAFVHAHRKFKYFVPWIAEDGTGDRALMATTITDD
jgi:hypothetical protein